MKFKSQSCDLLATLFTGQNETQRFSSYSGQWHVTCGCYYRKYKNKKGGQIYEERQNVLIGYARRGVTRSECCPCSCRILMKEQSADGSNYCHMKFPAIEERTLSGDRPVLKDPSTGDIVDFFGPCDEDPLGKNQVASQKLNDGHRWQTEFASD